jgi:predicted flap endonuclease-1-like 5' DNA nuclease
MHFVAKEKSELLEVKGVGPVVIKRLEEIGIHSLRDLSRYKTEDIVEMVASMLGASCWKNSPQSKKAISAAIELAQNSGK